MESNTNRPLIVLSAMCTSGLSLYPLNTLCPNMVPAPEHTITGTGPAVALTINMIMLLIAFFVVDMLVGFSFVYVVKKGITYSHQRQRKGRDMN